MIKQRSYKINRMLMLVMRSDGNLVLVKAQPYLGNNVRTAWPLRVMVSFFVY
jgi:hypothetical protein